MVYSICNFSFHVGSGCSDASTYISHIKAARELFDDALSVGFKLTLLDIGGGLYGNTGAEQKIRKVAHGSIVQQWYLIQGIRTGNLIVAKVILVCNPKFLIVCKKI